MNGINSTTAQPDDINNLCSRKLWELLSNFEDGTSLSKPEKQRLANTLINRRHYLSEVYNWQQQQLEILH